MKLYLLRHGVAVERGSPDHPDDGDRPLTNEGRDKVAQVAMGMKRLGLTFDLILSSPLRRARETAEMVAAALEATRRLRFIPSLAEEDAHPGLVREIAALRPPPECLLLVGHEPNLSELMALLLTGETTLPIHFKKAGLACLSVNGIEAGPCAMLEWLLAPKQLRLLA